MAEIELKRVEKSWGAFKGVDNVDLTIADQEFVVLLGPSGCGKTTTMRMIAGLEEPTAGEVFIDGESMDGVDPQHRDVAMVFQGYALYPNMTIYENIRFPLRMRGVAKSEHKTLIEEAASMVELNEFLHRKPAALSGGQRQRAALARAIVRQPQCFLMDEPLSNLDAKLRASMRVQIKHLQRQLKITTVYVTHDQIEAMTLADRIVIMDRGRIQQIGTPDDIYADPANIFVAGFIGSPPMNIVQGQADNGVFRAPGIEVPIPIATSQAIALGIRPEDCRVDRDNAHLSGQVYGIEPTGDMTLLTMKVGDVLFEVKADRDYRTDLDVAESIAFDQSRLYLFDPKTGERIRTS